MGNMTDYAYFAFSSFRFSTPIAVVDLDKEVEVNHQDDDYWLELSPRLHFISAALLDEVNVSAVEWARKIRATVASYPYGVVLDCGWSALGVEDRQSKRWMR